MAIIPSPPDQAAALVPPVPLAIGRCLFVEGPKRFHDVIETNGAAGTALPECWCGVDRARIGSPRGQDGAFLVQRKVGVGNDL